MASEQGYSNQKKKGKAQFKTIHSAGSDAFAEQVIPKYLYNVNLLDIAITNIQDILGTNGQVEFWKITMVAHNASVGNLLQIKTPSAASLARFEFEITSIIDVDNFLILPISNAKPAIGDTGLIKNWVSAASDSDGNPQIAIAPAPIKFKLDGVTTDVSKDSITPANSKLLPTENLIAQASLSSIDGKFTTLNAKDFATSAKQDTGNTSLISIDGKLTTLNAKDFSTSAKQDTGNTTLASILAQNADVDFTGSVTSVTPLVIPTTNKGTLAFNASGTWSGSVIIEASLDNITWVTTTYSALTTGNDSTTFSAPTSGQINTVGFDYIRFRSNTIASGSVTMVLQASRLVSNVMLDNPLPTGSNTIGAISQSGTWNITNVSGTVSLPTGASTLAEQQTQTTAIGSLTETAPATDTASSGLNGRLQRIAQRLTSLIALFPSSIGTKTSAASLSVVLASDQAAIGVTPGTSSGTITSTLKTVGTSAVRATVAGTAPSATRKRLLIKPSKNNTGSIYLGSSGVTTGTGLEIIGPDRLEFLLDSSDYYLISDTATQFVEIIEVA